MCDDHSGVPVMVTVPAHLSASGREVTREKGIDACIAGLVRALNEGGVRTVASCCGHGVRNGSIVLSDGRELRVFPTVEGMQPLR